MVHDAILRRLWSLATNSVDTDLDAQCRRRFPGEKQSGYSADIGQVYKSGSLQRRFPEKIIGWVTKANAHRSSTYWIRSMDMERVCLVTREYSKCLDDEPLNRVRDVHDVSSCFRLQRVREAARERIETGPISAPAKAFLPGMPNDFFKRTMGHSGTSMWCFIDGVVSQQVYMDLECSERLLRCQRFFGSRGRGNGFLRGRRVARLVMHASAGDPDTWRDVARSVSGSTDAEKVKSSRERPPPQWVAPPPGFELTSDSETSSSWASWRDAIRAMRAEQQDLQERVERGELIRDAEEERNFWRAAASELGAPAQVDRSAAPASAGSPLSDDERAVSGERAGAGDEVSSIPDSDEEWDPDTSWLQSYAPVGMETSAEGEPADLEMQQTSWYSGHGSQFPDEGSAGSGDAERDQGWEVFKNATDVIRDATSEEEDFEPRDPKKETAFWRGAAQELIGHSTASESVDASSEDFEPRDPKKETAFWRGAAQELIGHSTASESVDASSEDFEPRDPKKETAFWRGAAQELIGSLALSPERETEELSPATVSFPGSIVDSASPTEASAEQPTDPAEVWAAWRSTQTSFSATPDSSASVAETNWDSLPDNERWSQWREQQRKSWGGALDDLNRRHPRDRSKPRTEKSTIDRWRETASELWQSASNPDETQGSS